jgi:hypothetical protein
MRIAPESDHSALRRALFALPAVLVFACAGRAGDPARGAAAAESSNGAGDAGVTSPSEAGAGAVPEALVLTGCNGDYTVSTNIGAQSFPLVLDTGSSTLAVAGHDCAACASAGVNSLYEPGTGATDLHLEASAGYGDGSGFFHGEVWRDRVSLGKAGPEVDLALASIASENELLFPTTCRSGSHPIAGLFGFGPPENATAGTDAFVDRLASAGLAKIFTVELCDDGGKAWIGGFDPAALSETPRWTAMADHEPSYTVVVSDVAVDGQSLALDRSAYPPAIVDTGGPLLYLPQPVFDAVTTALGKSAGLQQLFGQGASFFASSDNCAPSSREQIDAALPPLTLTFGEGQAAVAVTAKASESYLLPVYDASGTEYWCPGIGTFPGGGMPSIDIGGAWLRSHVVIFDIDHHRMGFAAHATCP